MLWMSRMPAVLKLSTLALSEACDGRHGEMLRWGTGYDKNRSDVDDVTH